MVTNVAITPIYPNFPDGDGDAMPERDSHQLQVRDIRFACERVLRPLPRVHVGGNTFVYYNPACRQDNVAPDVYVALDVPRRRREKYQTWDEGKFPDLIVEILSPKTRKEDLGDKKDLYARLGAELRVIEGWLRVIDPTTGQPVPTPDEMTELLEEAEQARRAAQEQATQVRQSTEALIAQELRARLHAEERVAFLEAEVARLRLREPAPDVAEQGQAGHE